LNLLLTLQVVIGIGLVIFVHEAGHFVAARLCKVRVDVFSLGFGPRLIGWRWGKTLYQIAAVPVGGYVRMAGDVPDGSGREPAPDSLPAKSVGQRFFIYSGGVLMNVVFALVAFPIALSAGVPIFEPVIGQPRPGSPAWQAGLPAGTRIEAVEGEEMFNFLHLSQAVALANEGPLRFSIVEPGAVEPRDVWITPEVSREFGFPMIGVSPGFDPDLLLRVAEEGPAARAGLVEQDILIGVEGAPASLAPHAQLRWAFRSGDPFTLLVRRAGDPLSIEIAPEQDESSGLKFGFSPLQNLVGAQRPNPLLESWNLLPGERILALGTRPIANSQDWREALVELDSPAQIEIRKLDGALRRVPLGGPLEESIALALGEDLFLHYDTDSTEIEISPGQPAQAAGLLTGDRLVSLGGKPVQDWSQVLKVAGRLSRRAQPSEIVFERLSSDGAWERHTREVTPEPMPLLVYGFDLAPARSIYRAPNLGEAVTQGMAASWRFLTDTWMTLKQMAMQRISTEAVGGIITISAVSYSWASEGWPKLLFFLCMLSINLAFLNVLPIPVLDGGHLFFLVVEAVKGSPVSERTLGYSQVVGLVLILTLMIYVTYQDVMRLFPGP